MNVCEELTKFDELAHRVEALESEGEIRRLLARYMRIGDSPTLTWPGPEFHELFTRDVIWEGIGPRYEAEFGRHEGLPAVMAFFQSFRGRERRFVLNLHILGSEAIEVNGRQAKGTWMMLEPVSWNTGESALLSARLEIDFQREPEGWKIAHFRTSNIFIQPQLAGWGDDLSVRPA